MSITFLSLIVGLDQIANFEKKNPRVHLVIIRK